MSNFRGIGLLGLVLLGDARRLEAVEASTGIAVDRLTPALGPSPLIGGEGADVTAAKNLSFAISLGYLRDPLRLRLSNVGDVLSHPVRGQLVTDLSYEIGLSRILAVAVGLPIVTWNDGDRLRGTGFDDQPLTAAAGDLRLRLKAAVLGPPAQPGLHLALALQLTVPMGGQSQFAATSGITIEPRLFIDYRIWRTSWVVDLGVRFAHRRTLFDTTFGDEFTWTVGGILRLFDLGERFHALAIVEAAGLVGPSDGTRPTELRGALRAQWRTLSLDLGGGAGLVDQVAAPSFRVFAIFRGELGPNRAW